MLTFLVFFISACSSWPTSKLHPKYVNQLSFCSWRQYFGNCTFQWACNVASLEDVTFFDWCVIYWTLKSFVLFLGVFVVFIYHPKCKVCTDLLNIKPIFLYMWLCLCLLILNKIQMKIFLERKNFPLYYHGYKILFFFFFFYATQLIHFNFLLIRSRVVIGRILWN